MRSRLYRSEDKPMSRMENMIRTITAMEKELPPELVTEILVRLPAKSLCRFRYVSKSWLRLLTADTSFIQLHHQRATEAKITSFLLYEPDCRPCSPDDFYLVDDDVDFYHVRDRVALDSVVKLELPFHKWPKRYLDLLGICNGLLYLRDNNYSNLYVWNPLTQDHTTIQFPRIDPSDFPNSFKASFGFGYCQSTKVYKAIRILSDERHSALASHSHVSVNTLGENSWRILEIIPYKVCEHATLVRGAFHWLGNTHGSISYAIVCFSIQEEVFQELPLPFICRDKCNVTIGELSGLLHMYYNVHAQSVEVWVMEEYGVVDSWTKLFKIDKTMLPDSYWQLLIPRGVTKKGDIILQIKGLEARGSSLVLYNPETNYIRNLRSFPCVFREAYSYVGSLTSPRLINEAMILSNYPSKELGVVI